MNERQTNSVELDDARESQLMQSGRAPAVDKDFVSWLDARMKSAEWATYSRGSEDFLGIETDLEKLSKSDPATARKLWVEHAAPGTALPIYLTPEYEATQARRAPDAADAKGSPERAPEGAQKPTGEHAKNSGYKIPAEISTRYLVTDNKFFFRDAVNKLAFEDRGRRMVTEHNNPDVAKSLVDMASAKGWNKIKVNGHEDFKAEVWLQATLKGIEVTGYKPKDVDLAKLQELQSSRAKNSIEHDGSKVQSKARAPERAPDEEKAYAAPVQNKADNFKGKLLDQGHADYDFDPKNDKSYFVKLETANGTKMHWGMDLERAMEHAGSKIGELVELERLGKKPVTVQEKHFDAQGVLIGYKPVETERVEWKATALSKAQEATVAVAKVAEVAINAPTTKMVQAERTTSAAPKAKPDERVRDDAQPTKSTKAPPLSGDYKVAATVLEKLLKKEGVSPDVLKRVRNTAAEMLRDMEVKGRPAPGVKVFDRAATRERPREKLVTKSKENQQERSR